MLARAQLLASSARTLPPTPVAEMMNLPPSKLTAWDRCPVEAASSAPTLPDSAIAPLTSVVITIAISTNVATRAIPVSKLPNQNDQSCAISSSAYSRRSSGSGRDSTSFRPGSRSERTTCSRTPRTRALPCALPSRIARKNPSTSRRWRRISALRYSTATTVTTAARPSRPATR